ncbi:hypothetical protein MIR68_009994 [Amoeboaphelidium protococcarum]|nr:hypothetical protein MIR68_009994 [Amoeboaphelidium protococcarum]
MSFVYSHFIGDAAVTSHRIQNIEVPFESCRGPYLLCSQQLRVDRVLWQESPYTGSPNCFAAVVLITFMNWSPLEFCVKVSEVSNGMVSLLLVNTCNKSSSSSFTSSLWRILNPLAAFHVYHCTPKINRKCCSALEQ